MDLLSSLLSSLRIESTSVSRWSFRAPWGVAVTKFEPGYFLSVVEGQCWVRFQNEDPIELQTGDSVMAPLGKAGDVLSSPASDTVSIWDLPWRGDTFKGLDADHMPTTAMEVSGGGTGKRTRLLGLAFTFRRDRGGSLLDHLPAAITLRADDAGIFALTHPAIDFLLGDKNPGYNVLATRVAELLVIGVLRAYILTSDVRAVGWLRGIHDPAVAKAMTAIHSAPHLQWTVATLAATAALSRSGFASRFSRLVGQTPIEYLHQCRIRKATELLLGTMRPVADIAYQVGYQSDRLFRLTFKKFMGVPPREYRKKSGRQKIHDL